METDPLAIIATIGVLGVVVKSIVDAVRRQWPTLDGALVQAIAWALGIGAAATFGVQGAEALLEFAGGSAASAPPVAVDYIITGAAIAAGAGFLAEISGRSANTRTIIETVEVSGEEGHA